MQVPEKNPYSVSILYRYTIVGHVRDSIKLLYYFSYIKAYLKYIR